MAILIMSAVGFVTYWSGGFLHPQWAAEAMARVWSANKSSSIDQNPQTAHAAAFILDGIFAGKKKKAKQSNPAVGEISQSLYSCRSSKVTVASLPVVETHGCVHA